MILSIPRQIDVRKFNLIAIPHVCTNMHQKNKTEEK